jgi:hypothetical protein
MGWFFLSREVRPNGDVPDDLGFEKAKDYKAKISFPPHKSPPSK